jgi:general secretion pathway protein D
VISKVRTSLLLAAVVSLAGCAAMRPIPPVAVQLPAGQSTLAPGYAYNAAPEREEPAEQPGSAGGDAGAGLVRPGTGAFINRAAAAKAPPPAVQTGDVSFNFEGESLHAVIKAILGEILQENYVIAPGVQGTVTFSTAKPLRGDQALSVLEMLLRWNNATLVWEDGRYTILPVGQAIPGNLTPRTGPAANARGYEVRAIPLRFISAVEMEKVLKPYAKPEAVVNIDPARNMIVLAGTRAELENYLQTVEVFDVDWLAGMSVGIFNLQQAEAGKVVAELEKIFGDGSNTPLAGMFRFIPLEGTNGVMVITPQERYLATIQDWLERFDMGSGEAGQNLYVYDVKNVKAVDLATTLSDIFGTSGGSSAARTTRPSGTVAPGMQAVEVRSFAAERAEARAEQREQRQQRVAEARGGAGNGEVVASGPEGVVDAAGGISLGATDQVRISAVEESNALMIRATSGQWASIRRVIERLDQIPLQVVIEAHIVQVALTDRLQFGVRWYFENAVTDAVFGAGGAELSRVRNSWTDVAGSIVGANTSWAFIGRNAGAILEMLDNVTSLKVLSAPSLVVLNNKAAEINSGVQVPISSTSVNLGTGGTGVPISSTQYLQTGITLSVTPRVNPGGLVFLEIAQEDSAAGDAPAGVNPPISTSSINTEVAVQSGETVVLGGLIKQQDSTTSAGLPYLSRIPVVGGLFGSKTQRSDRQELLVLITPRVIRDPYEARRITDEYKTRFRGLQPMLPVESPRPY